MDKSKLIQNNIRKEILKKNSRINTLNYVLNNEDNEQLLEEVEEDLKKEKKQLSDLMKKLNEEIINDKKTKAYYKKSLKNISESLTEFAKLTRGDDNLKKGINNIHNTLLMMEKYLNG